MGHFFAGEFLRPRRYGRVWYFNILPHHNANGISVVFLPTFLSLVTDIDTSFFHVWIALK